MFLTSLSEYLILLVCFELPVADIFSLRQACRSLYRATRAKVLWICIVERRIHGCKVLPPCMKRYDLLDSGALEVLACRMARLDVQWETGLLSSTRNWRLDLPQTITWLRLVAGTWLFVASSDNHVSKINCWDLTLVFRGRKEPVAEPIFPAK
ncbi:hypothetical protein B0H12DRAFT_302740 [Mycena haematopus]|nr:hypothetical protein B0H12DRAFT_302740 [Mycena haematopus]